jgi:hypothetical protein
MSRTCRRRRHRYEYRWVLCDRENSPLFGAPLLLDRHSQAGRRAIARFHSDNEVTMRSTAPRWYRKVFDRRLRTFNDRQLRRWLADPDYDPVFEPNHRHSANWAWW